MITLEHVLAFILVIKQTKQPRLVVCACHFDTQMAEAGRITRLAYTVSSRAVRPPGYDYLRRGDERAGETGKKGR